MSINNLTKAQRIELTELAQALWNVRAKILRFQSDKLDFQGVVSEELDAVRSCLCQATGKLVGVTDIDVIDLKR